MNKNFESTVESSRKAVSDFGAQAKERLLTQVRAEPAKTLSLVLAGSVVLSVLLGYCLSRMEKNSRRERLVEDWMREVTNWIGQHGRKIAVPIKEGLEATPGVTATRGMAWINEGKLNYRNDPAMKDKDPGIFKMYAVPLPKP